MEFTLNIVYGGELNASKALSPFVRNMRKIIKDTFTSFENEAVTMFKEHCFLMVIFHPIITEQEYINQDITMLKKNMWLVFALTGHNGLGIRKKI